ncbi:MAG TPA: phosphatidate cytidylyltransferase [Anaerolineaceae bacterium]|nr:phosphatidate cytidylyltransferase [Anaerolineaceae bacterium]
MKPDLSLRKRLIVINIMVPALVIFSILGGWAFTIFVAVVLLLATWELWRLFNKGFYSPSLLVMGIFVPLAVILRHLYEFKYSDAWLAALVLTAMLFHVLQQERGGKTAAIDFMITVGGTVYLGWLGSYAVSLRALENGLYWVVLVFPIISLADSGAYIFGRLLGKHKMLPRVSPKKTWEGYLGGILVGMLGGFALAALWNGPAPNVLAWHGLILGAVISILAPFGDYGESMIKRQFGAKDSGHFLLEHGGFLDRMDSSLWAAVIGYYVIILLTR